MKIKSIWFWAMALSLVIGVALLATNHGGRADQIFGWLLVGLLVTLCLRLFSPIKPDIQLSEKKSVLVWVFVGVSFLIVFRSIFLSSFVNLGNDSNLVSSLLLNQISVMPQTWESELGGVDLGHNQVVNMWMQPLWIFISGLAKLGMTYPLLVKGLMIIQILIGSFGIYHLFKKLNMASWTIPIGVIFYFLNTYYLVNVDGGLIFLSFAYACFPAGVYFVLNLTENNSIKNWVIASSWLVIMSFFDIRIVLLTILMSVVWIIIARKYKSLFKILGIGIILVVVHLYWILPALKTGLPLPISYGIGGNVEQFNLFSSGHLLLLSQPHWYSNIFGVIQSPRWYFIGIPLLVIVALGFAKVTPKSKLFVSLTIVGLLLIKGGQLYLWLYKYLPGFIFFRDPSKFSPLLILGYTGLMCMALEVIGQRIPKLKNLLVLGVGIYFFSLAGPVYTNLMSGTFTRTPGDTDYEEFSKTLDSQEFSRMLWLPTKPQAGIIAKSPVWTEAGWLLGKRPFLSAVDGTYELYNYVRATESAGLFDVTGIKYLLYPFPDERKRILKPDEIEYYQWQKNWFKSQLWLKDISPFSSLAVFEVATVSGKFYEPRSWLWVVGSDNTYAQLAKLANYRLANIGVTHLNNSSIDISDRIKPGQYLYFNKVGFLDLVMTQAKRSNLISPYSFVSPGADGQKQWWGRGVGNFIFIKNYLKDHYNVNNNDYDFEMGYAVAEGEKTLQINHNFPEGHWFIRILQSKAGGKLEFIIDGKSIVEETTSDDEVFIWKDLGVYPATPGIELKSSGAVNIVNALAIIPNSEYERLVADAKVITSRLQLITDLKNLPRADLETPSLKYSQLSQTEYLVEVQNAPAWIVFSESYDPRWQISASQSSPIPAYDMLNAFWVDKPGSYRIFYTPQIWVMRGLGVTGGAFLLLVLVLLWRRKNGEV